MRIALVGSAAAVILIAVVAWALGSKLVEPQSHAGLDAVANHRSSSTTEQGTISLGTINEASLGYTAVASDEHNMLVALVRNRGETRINYSIALSTLWDQRSRSRSMSTK
jgi:hypothetical protein